MATNLNDLKAGNAGKEEKSKNPLVVFSESESHGHEPTIPVWYQRRRCPSVGVNSSSSKGLPKPAKHGLEQLESSKMERATSGERIARVRAEQDPE